MTKDLGPRQLAQKARIEQRLRTARDEWLKGLAEATDFRTAYRVCLGYVREDPYGFRPRDIYGIPEIDRERDVLRHWVLSAEHLVARHDALVAFAGMLHREGILATAAARDASVAMAEGLLACWFEDDGLSGFAEALETGDFTKMVPPPELRLTPPPEERP
jgi:hypothetical protein